MPPPAAIAVFIEISKASFWCALRVCCAFVWALVAVLRRQDDSLLDLPAAIFAHEFPQKNGNDDA